MHSPTKRFVHNNRRNMMYRTNVFAAATKKKRKLGMNYSGTDDDPSSLNHRLKLKLSQHTYNQVLQSELLGFSAQHSNITNQVFSTNNANDDTIKNDNISSLQMDVDPDPLDTSASGRDAVERPMPTIYASPSLPNRRLGGSPARRKGNRSKDEEERQRRRDEDGQSKHDHSHHPLCPCHHHADNGRADDPSLGSSESELPHDAVPPMDVEAMCVCDSITSNVATDFLMSPQRTLRYRYSDREHDRGESMQNQENVHFGGNMTMTPLTKSSQCQLSGSKRTMRNIAKSPFKVLDAPRLTDDFYLNLVDWSSSCNILSVGLGECVYLWSAFTSKVTKLCDLKKSFSENPRWMEGVDPQQENDMVCSVGWSRNHQSALNNCITANTAHFGSPRRNGTKSPTPSDLLAVGGGSGHVFVFDTIKSKLIRAPLQRHHHRVGVIAWMDSNVVASGSRDRSIFLRDIRVSDRESDITRQLHFHKQEVCGLKWSEDALYLASGGNDNKMAIWDIRSSNKPLCYGKHKAAVKAITWSPHDTGLIATGGGTADRCIKFWNINNFISSSKKEQCGRARMADSGRGPTLLKPTEVIDTGSQVCNLLWSKNVNEIVSTHGYSLNQIVVWKFPSMEKIVTLTGHTYRVLYLAGSPDGQTVVTGAGDETLRLWNVFPPTNHDGNDARNFVPSSYSIPLLIR